MAPQDESDTGEAHIPLEEHPPSFGSKLASFGKAAIAETKRNAHLAALKAKIEKAKLVDLRKAHAALGRKAYELQIAPDRFASAYDELAQIESSIIGKRAGGPVADDATAVEKAKNVALNAKMKAEAEALELKQGNRLTALGREIEQLGEIPGIEEEFRAVSDANSAIKELEERYSSIAGDHATQNKLRSLSASLAGDAANQSGRACLRIARFFGNPNTRPYVIAAVIMLLVALFAWGFTSKRDSLGVSLKELRFLHPDIPEKSLQKGGYFCTSDQLMIRTAEDGTPVMLCYSFSTRPEQAEVNVLLEKHRAGSSWLSRSTGIENDEPEIPGETISRWSRKDNKAYADLEFSPLQAKQHGSHSYSLWLRTRQYNNEHARNVRHSNRMSFEPLPPSSALLSLSGSVRGDARLPLGVDLNYFRKNFPAIQEEKIDKEDRFKPGSRAFFVKQNDGTCLQFECDGDVVYLVCLESPFSLGRAHAQQLLQPFANHSAWVFEPGGLNYQGYWVRDDKAAACTALFGSTEGTLWVYSAEFAEWLHKRDSAQN